MHAARWSVTPLALLSALALARGVAAEPAAAAAVQRAHQAAMAGEKAVALAAAQELLDARPVAQVLKSGQSGWELSAQYAVLVRFGLWDELIALEAPPQAAPGATAAYLYGRGVALAARGRLDEARGCRTALAALAESDAAGLPAGANSLGAVIAVAEPVIAARIAATEGNDAEAVRLLRQGLEAEEALARDTPPDWFFPVRHLLGAQLLIGGQWAQAEAVYRADLAVSGENGWALFGLAQALRAQGRLKEGARAASAQARAFAHADIRLPASAFWFAGADTTSCECQRFSSADGQPGGELLGAQHEARVH